LSMLSSPLGMVGVGIGATTALLYKGVQAAGEFNNQFLELRQLNLDKPKAELDGLSDRVLDLSFKLGANATSMAKAFYDVQSATGRFGDEVADITEKTFLFSKVTKADFDASITGAVKAVNAFGLAANDMDGYFASSAKTVQVGITTFKELAEVQTDYAGAAAAVNQSIDDANKLFAAFTLSSKSAREGATLTKTAFQDLTKRSTLEGLQKHGVHVFNELDESMRSVNDIVTDLVPALQRMSDLQFAQLKEDIGGSEGLRGLLNQAKSSGDKMLDAFRQFDETDFDWAKAIENANGDWRIMSGLIGNKVNAKLIQLGNQVMPSIVAGGAKMVDFIDKASGRWSELYDNSALFRMVLSNIGDSLMQPFELLGDMATSFQTMASWAGELTRPIFSAAEGVSKIWQHVKGIVTESSAWSFGKALFGDVSIYWETFKGYLQMMKSSLGNIWEAFNQALALNFSGAAAALRGDLSNPLTNVAASGGGLGGAASTPDSTSPSVDAAATGRGISDISGGGKTVKNITVNITKMVESINIHTSEVRGELADIERKIEEYLVRAINGAEMAVSNG